MRTHYVRLLLAAAIAPVLVALVACADSGELDELRAENERLRQEIDQPIAAASTETPSPETPSPSPAATRTASPSPTPTETSTEPPTPTPEPTPEPGRFVVTDHWLTKNVIGTPEVHVTVTNQGAEVIDAFDLLICAYDAYGDPVEEYGYGSHCFNGVAADARVPVGGTYTTAWTLYGREFTRSVEVAPARSHTLEGSTWQQ